MAVIKRKGYAQVEINHVGFRRDGRFESQVAFTGAEGDTCENGMILAVDKANKEAGYAGTTLENKIFGLVFTSEELYDGRTPGLKDFALKVEDGVVVGPNGYNVLPRIGYLAPGDIYTTNAISGADTGVTVTKGDYAKVGASGFVEMTGTTAPTAGVVLQAADVDATLPDGQSAVKFVVIDA